ncbi:hypothetical protein J3459_016305 [Metarhizium acridum]|uniref:uncharacterized protein n=1 Tax=Metarhizium acridum TaxID=92637 RepID=UPI001C6C668B|nr:hypothetical protein J3458_021374 [Metarhizium acridum]KAG8411808.1 hypothetical protein J3459_016305 [Metarhizium acridum]
MVSVSLLVNVGKWVASFAVKAAWKSLSQNDAGHATEILRGISTGQHEVARQIENLSIKVEILDSMRRILYWSKRMDEVMDDFKKLNGGQINATDLAYVELLSALRDENLGIRYSTFSIYNAIMGLPGQGAGAIHVWHKQAMSKLSDEKNLYYHMSDYVKEMDDNLGPITYLLRQGLVLSLFTSHTETDAERLYKEFHDQVTTISNTLLKLYPPGLRFLKPSLEDAGSQDGSQWLKWQQADNSNHHLVMHNFYIPVLGSAREPIQTKKPEAWQFALQQNEEPLGAMQFLSAWENKGNKRLRYSKKYQQGWSINFSTSKNRDTSAILFKLIPLEGKKPEFRFVPYLEGSMGIVSDKKRTFDWKFVAVAE